MFLNVHEVLKYPEAFVFYDECERDLDLPYSTAYFLQNDKQYHLNSVEKNHLILTNASIGFSEKDFQKVKNYFSKNKSNIFSQIFK